MAFAFFRRRQKLVMVIMAGLMVVFILSSVITSKTSGLSHSSRAIGHTKLGDLTTDDRQQALDDLRILTSLGLDNLQVPMPGVFSFYTLTKQRDPMADLQMMRYGQKINAPMATEADLGYALLLREAQKAGVHVGSAEADAFLAQIDTEEHMSQFRSQRQITQKDLRGAVERWMTISRMFDFSTVDTPPSSTEAQFIARQLFEKIKLQILPFQAEKYLDKVKNLTFTPEQIQGQFQTYRNHVPDQFEDANSFGFGYVQPMQVNVTYALVDRQAIERVARPSREAIKDYYLEHRDEFAVAASQPASGPAAATEANAPQRVKDLSEVLPEIEQALSADAVQSKMNDAVGAIRSLVQEFNAGGKGEPAQVFQWVRSKMLATPEAVSAVLARPVTLEANQVSLKDAVEQLADKARLTAISFPWGRHGDKSLDPQVKVTLMAKDMPLGKALDELVAQAKWSPMQWGMCAGFEGVLFPLSGDGSEDLFPVQVRTTGMISDKTFQKDSVLSAAVKPANRQPMIFSAFYSVPVQGAQAQKEALKAGEDGPAMVVLDTLTRQPKAIVLWRLLGGAPQSIPPELTDDLRKQVTDDLHLQAAYDLAQKAAAEIATVAQFDSAAQKGEANTVESDFFARWSNINQPSDVPPLALPENPLIRQTFVSTAFSLEPNSVEPPFDPKSGEIAKVALPPTRTVYVMRRIGFEPLVKKQFDEMYQQILGGVAQNGMRQSLLMWFQLKQIKDRLSYTPEGSMRE